MTHPIGSWKRRLRQWIAVAAVLILGVTLVQATGASSREAPAFDFDKGNALTGVIYPHFQKAVRTITPGGDDAPIVADHILLVETAWFDAIAPYHPTAVGIYSNLGRQPRSEATTRNRNTAVIYAAYTTLTAVFPQFKDDFRKMMTDAGLDPDNKDQGTNTPAGIGKAAANGVLDARKRDGSNRNGDEGDRKYNLQPLEDTTGYRPKNTPYEILDPSHWQPRTINNHGIVRSQEFISPHYGLVKPITYGSPTEFSLGPPVNSDHNNRAAYKAQVDEVLSYSASLDDDKKALAEFFNDKVHSLGFVTGNAAFDQNHFDIEKAVQYVTTVDLAIFDVAIVTWHFKRMYDSVRPFTAVHYLYGDQKITAWGGPGKGTVTDMPGKDWRSYLETADHTEYPSASSGYCLAYTQAARRFLGTDKLNVSFTFKKGTSKIEPGITPSKDVTLHWDNLTDVANACRISRVIGGVHFRSATQGPESYAPKVGDLVYDFIQRKLNGG